MSCDTSPSPATSLRAFPKARQQARITHVERDAYDDLVTSLLQAHPMTASDNRPNCDVSLHALQ